MQHLEVDSAGIAYDTWGDGEPVLLMHPGLLADGMLPLIAEPALSSRYRLIWYHRRGYGSSSLGDSPLTVAGAAADAAALLGHLGVERAHIVGHSAGGLVALQLAFDAPERVHSLALLEPALLTQIPSGPAFIGQYVLPAVDRYRTGDKPGAVEAFLRAVFGPGWQPAIEHVLPGAIEQALEDADTFFASESPAVQRWILAPEQAAAVQQPVLYMVGDRSGRLRSEGREFLHRWIDQIEDCDLPGCTHLLQLQDPRGAAQAVAAFLRRHPKRDTAPAVTRGSRQRRSTTTTGRP